MGGGSAAYRRVEVETASPERLVVMLFNGAIRRVDDARHAIAAGDRSETHSHLIVAQEIITELRGALDLTAGDVAHNLNRVYEYLHHLLVQANLKKEPAPLDECLEHLHGLRDAWADVCSRPHHPDAPEVAPVHNALGHTAVNIEG
jgi:flagellar protein FliS